MSNHFHLLVRVPHRPEGFDVPLEVVLARLERAIGDEAMGAGADPAVALDAVGTDECHRAMAEAAGGPDV